MDSAAQKFRATPRVADGNYVCVDVPSFVVRRYLRQMRKILGLREYARFRWRRFLRDGRKHHATVIAPPEFKGSPVNFATAEISVIGLGMARTASSSAEDICYYIVVESPELQNFRRSLGLKEKDLHITLGFRRKDIHGVPKNRSTLLR